VGESQSKAETSASLFRVIADYTYDWEAWVDSEGVTRWINPALERITGYRVDECIDQPDYLQALTSAEDQPLIARVLADAAAGGSGNDVEFRIAHKGGEQRWVAISWQAMRSAQGEQLGYRTSIRDIEERKRIEAELHVMRRRAEAAAIARSELLANVSHELRSPVHCIAGFADLLTDSALDSVQRRYVELIARECTGMLRHVEDLLQLAAIEAGGARLERRPFDLEELLRGVIEGERVRAETRGLSLTSQLSLAPSWVEGDPTRVGQVVRNLLDNALKFTDQGAVRVRATSRHEAEWIHIDLQVSDSGSGMDARDIERLLEPFQQASTTTTRRHGGVGLGLSIVRRLVAAMDGSLHIESAKDRGTRVHVQLRLKNGRTEPTVEPVEPQAGTTHTGVRGTVLVVDDSAPARELLRALLERRGHRVLEADSCRAAVARVAEAELDLVLLDYQMPDSDGTETAVALRRALRAKKAVKRPAIYLLTANVFAREQLDVGSGAIDGVLEKPLSRAALDELLSAHLRVAHASATCAVLRSRKLLDQLALEDLTTLTDARGEPLLRKLLERTRSDQAEALAELTDAAERHDLPVIERAAHRIAGQAAVIAAPVVARRARRLEDRAQARELSREQAVRAARALERAWRLSERALTAVARGSGAELDKPRPMRE
jgi:PAS domain S-box-containing protein